jgi:choline/glycine/proline betaine transport protein
MSKDTEKRLFDIHGPVFYPATIIIVLFIALTLFIGKPMEQVFSTIQTGMSDYTGWFFVLAVNIFVSVAIYLAFSKYRTIRLGGKDAKPEFSTFAWFAMLFSAGMGIGLLFFSVAEPMTHFGTPPVPTDNMAQRAGNAMTYTLLHWGLHAWAIYALVGLSLAFFTYNKGLPLTIRSVFYPLLGDRIYGTFGNVIDVVAVVATLFGLATSLGFGVQQVAAGLNHLFGLPDTIMMQVALIAIITLAATISVVTGLHSGVRILSELNMRLGLVFLILMLIIGPTLTLLDGFIQNTGAYLQSFLAIGTWGETYAQSTWQNDWTLVYWAWWISWSPFVGIFIARVSKGRTVQEFILGVLLVPTLLTFLWFSVFGGSALYLELNGIGNIAVAVEENIATALFVMLEEFPLSFLTSIIGIVLVTSFFVTSSDSGSLVIDSITSGGKLDAPVGQRIFWAVSEGAVAATLLIGGGLAALQTAALTSGLPFTIILLLMCYSLFLGLREAQEEIEERKKRRDRESYQKVISNLLQERKEKKS